MPCQACTLPGPLSDCRFAYLWPPQGHTLHKIAGHLDHRGYSHRIDAEGNFATVTLNDPNHFLVDLSGLLTEAEREDTRCLFTDNESPDFAEFGNVASINRLMARMRGDWLVELLDQKRYASFRQPIVSLEEGFGTVGHEYLFRGYEADGDMVSPAALFESAADPRIFFNLDRAARLSAVETAARLGGDDKIFINFMPGSVYDPGVCLRTTVNAIIKAEIDPRRVIFEIVESERITDLNHLRGIVNFYRAAGFRIALDDYGTGFNNLETLMRLEPDYLKIDKALVHHMTMGDEKREMVATLVDRCRRNGIVTIGEGVEDGETAQLLRDSGVDLGQGYFFGRPAAPEEAMAVA